MKILELRFKNLNSLYGEWKIDFTSPEYTSNGIFALTGPTGAGKSTILDAICLALYGMTPRLKNITQSSNEIMSRQTGECYAEVLFESQAGCFRCHWVQQRARKSVDGRLQDPKHEIADGRTGEIVENKKSRVSDVVVKKTGMDFDRFTRSILLAQGQFDTFLKADTDVKSTVLEQITGTEIYSEISRRVHLKKSEEEDKLKSLQSETSFIKILDAEEENQMRENLSLGEKEEAELSVKVKETDKAVNWLRTVKSLDEEIKAFRNDAVNIKNEMEEFAPDKKRLEVALRAAALDGVYASLTSLRKEQADDISSLETKKRSLPEIEESAAAQEKLLKGSEDEAEKAKDEIRKAQPLIKEIRSLDHTLDDTRKKIKTENDQKARIEYEVSRYKNEGTGEKKKLNNLLNELNSASSYLKEHGEDEWLVENQAGLEEKMNSRLLKQQEISRKENDILEAIEKHKQFEKDHEKAVKESTALKNELNKALEKLEKNRNALDKLLGGRFLREYRTEKENLIREQGYIKTIENLEELRKKLEDGKACPLCGSTDHPFAQGNVPEDDEISGKIDSLTQLIGEAEKIESAIKKVDEAKSAAQNRLSESEKNEVTIRGRKETAGETIDELKKTLELLKSDLNRQKDDLALILQPFGFSDMEEADLQSVSKSLSERRKAWQDHKRKEDDASKMVTSIENKIEQIKALWKKENALLEEKKENLDKFDAEYSILIQERQKLYGEKNPDEEEEKLNRALSSAEEKEKNQRIVAAKSQELLTNAKSNVELLQKRIEKRKTELAELENDFSDSLKDASFKNEQQFLDVILPAAERDRLSDRLRDLQDKESEIRVKLEDREKRYKEEKIKKFTEKNLDELVPLYEEYEETLQKLRESIISFKHRLNDNEEAKKTMKEKAVAIEAQKNECLRWEKLHGYIGSADGKKYRTFAQGLTFELMVSQANIQLRNMTDRYLLMRDENAALELNVVDNYQAGETRTTKNLSGGESFIVSLALALGLSKMASSNVRVDSLFLDEGFGTLDEEALETALETLSGIQQDGKLIGIISHVNALKERIGTRINIEPVSGGHSTITGPGCMKTGK